MNEKEIKTNDKEVKSITVPYKVIRKMVDNLGLHCADDTPISFEAILTCLFPSVYENIMKYGNDCYMQGYMEARNESKGNN